MFYSLGYLIESIRHQAKMSQSELAERIGTKQPQICRYESGRTEPSISTLRRIAAAVGCRVEILIRKTNKKG